MSQLLIDICNGETRTIPISAGLETILKQLRSECDKLPIFCDQVCINQNDERDKLHQVALVGLVYENAIKVFAWLGDLSELNGEAQYYEHVYLSSSRSC
jgi:heterokaryon incompatibility protein (HET)